MKICLINNLFWPFNRGGAESVVFGIAKQLNEDHHQVFLITTRPWFAKADENIFTTYHLPSLYYQLAKLPKFIRLFWHIFDQWGLFKYLRIKKILEKEKPDLVLTHNLKGLGFLCVRIPQKLHIAHIHTIHDLQLLHPSGLMIYGHEKVLDSWQSKIYQQINKIIFNSLPNVIFPSSWIQNEYQKIIFFKHAHQEKISNPFSLFVDCADNKKSSSLQGVLKILFVGQIEEYKGVFFLAENISTWKKILNCELQLNIVGDGTGLAGLQKKYISQENIKFFGKRSAQDVKKFMKSADCLVVPSLCYENFPTVICEAAGCQLPVIASKIGGISELLAQVGGIDFQVGNSEDLRKKLEYLITNYEFIKLKIAPFAFSEREYLEKIFSLIK